MINLKPILPKPDSYITISLFKKISTLTSLQYTNQNKFPQIKQTQVIFFTPHRYPNYPDEENNVFTLHNDKKPKRKNSIPN